MQVYETNKLLLRSLFFEIWKYIKNLLNNTKFSNNQSTLSNSSKFFEKSVLLAGGAHCIRVLKRSAYSNYFQLWFSICQVTYAWMSCIYFHKHCPVHFSPSCTSYRKYIDWKKRISKWTFWPLTAILETSIICTKSIDLTHIYNSRRGMQKHIRLLLQLLNVYILIAP